MDWTLFCLMAAATLAGLVLGHWRGYRRGQQRVFPVSMPMQPIYGDESGRARFRENKIVTWMLEQGRAGAQFDLNTIACLAVPQEDYVQLMQLIGYSLQGFHELSGVPDTVCLAASAEARRLGLESHGCRDAGCEIHCGV